MGPQRTLGFDIVSLGESMVEFNQTGQQGGRNDLQGCGGDSSNFAIAAARPGARVAYVGALGDDPYGSQLRDLWTREGVDHAGVHTDPEAFTAIYFVTHDAAGHHFHFFRAGSAASRLRPAQLPRHAIEGARVLHLWQAMNPWRPGATRLWRPPCPRKALARWTPFRTPRPCAPRWPPLQGPWGN